MVSLKAFLLLTVSAVVALASLDVNPEVDFTNVDTASELEKDDLITFLDAKFKKGRGFDAEINDILLSYLTAEEFDDLLDELNFLIVEKVGKATGHWGVDTVYSTNCVETPERRIKLKQVDFTSALNAVLSNAEKDPDRTYNGDRVTEHYKKQGDYSTTLADFDSFEVTGEKDYDTGKIKVKTGKNGPNTVTARDGSKQGSPTLETISPIPPSPDTKYKTCIRKIRYESAQTSIL